MDNYVLVKERNRYNDDPYRWFKESHMESGVRWGIDKSCHYRIIDGMEIVEERQAEDFPTDNPYRTARAIKLQETVTVELTRAEIETILNGLFWSDNEGQGHKGQHLLRDKLEAL